MPRQPSDKPESFSVEPLKLVPKEKGKPGPKKAPEWNYLALDFKEPEQERFAYFVWSIEKIIKNPTPFDKILIELAAIEYVKYLRIAQYEVQKNTSITMARQHPGTQMRALIDLLSISRKSRNANKQESDSEREEAMNFLKSLAG
jgi:hypothetical protein